MAEYNDAQAYDVVEAIFADPVWVADCSIGVLTYLRGQVTARFPTYEESIQMGIIHALVQVLLERMNTVLVSTTTARPPQE